MSDKEDFLIDEEKENNTQYSRGNQSWFKRTFSAMSKGSQRGAILLVIVTALGTGVFTLHKTFLRVGIVNGTILLFLVGFLLIYSSNLVIHASKRNTECQSLSHLVEKLFGFYAKMLYNGIFAFTQIVVGIAGFLAFSKTFYQNFEEIIWKIFNVSEEKRNVIYFNKYMIWVVGLISFSIVSKRSLDGMGYISMISFFIYVAIVGLIILQAPDFVARIEEPKYNFFKFGFEEVSLSIGILLSAMNNIAQYYGVNQSINAPTFRRLKKVFTRGIVVMCVLYLAAGVFGYLILANEKAPSTDLFIFRDPLKDSLDIPMIILRTFLLIGILCGASLNLHPCKSVFLGNLNAVSQTSNLIVSILLVLVSCFVGSIFTNVSSFMTFAGIFGGTMIAFTFPGLFGIKSGYAKSRFQKICLYSFTIIMTFLGLIGTYYSLKNFK